MKLYGGCKKVFSKKIEPNKFDSILYYILYILYVYLETLTSSKIKGCRNTSSHRRKWKCCRNFILGH